MKVLIFLAAVVAAACAVNLSDVEVKRQFESFKLQHGKTYASEAEELYRHKIFKENAIRIHEHNERYRKGDVTFTVKINQFADMHHHEIVEARNGLRATLKKPSPVLHKAPNTPWPWSTGVDWRSKGYVTEVKDQGNCGSCWTFSATGAVEGQMIKKYGKTVSLSEQNLVDCTREAPYEQYGCDGGVMDTAFQYIADNKGIDSEASYPYRGVDGSCKFNRTNVAGNVKTYVDIRATEKDLQHAVQTIGPVSVAIDASKWTFSFYDQGIYYDKSCGNTENDLDHGVLAVGFGSSNGKDYWIVKNSWGPNWGENGFVRMARNRNNHCGIALMASYPKV